MNEGESFCNHLIRPGPFFAAMVVKRRADALHEILLFRNPDEGKLKERRTAVEDHRQADDHIGEWISRCHGEEGEKYAYCL